MFLFKFNDLQNIPTKLASEIIVNDITLLSKHSHYDTLTTEINI